MTRRDHLALAGALAEIRAELRPVTDDESSTLAAVANRLADVLAADNPRFDRARFLTAANVEEDDR